MKFITIGLSLALTATSASAQSTLDAVDVNSVLTKYYDTLPTIVAAASTSIASQLHSLETSWAENPAATSLAFAIMMMPDDAQSSLVTATAINEVATAAYFTTNLAPPLQTAFVSLYGALESVKAQATSTSTSKAAAARHTGMAVLGAAGVVGGVLAVL